MSNRQRMSKKDWQQKLEALKKLPPPEIEHKDQCFHRTLVKIIDDDLYYQCPDCKTVILIVGAALYEPTAFLNLCLQVADHLTGHGLTYLAEEGES